MSSEDEEEEIIRNYLRELQEDLAIPFKDKKEQIGIKENLEDEIVTLFEDIQIKEDQLKQVLEIANILTTKKQEIEKLKSQEIQNLENTLYEIQTSAEVTQQTANSYQSNVDQKEFIVKLQQEIKNLEEQNKQQNTEVKDLREQQKVLSHEYKITVETVQKQQYENKNLRQNLEESKIQISKMKNELDQYQKYVEFQNQEKNEIQQQIEQLKEKITDLEGDKQLLQSELKNPSLFQHTLSDYRDIKDRHFSMAYDEVQIDGTEQNDQFNEHFGVIEDKKIVKMPSPEEVEQKQIKQREEKLKQQKEEQKLRNISLLKPSAKISSSNASVLKTKNTEQLQKVLENNKNPHKLPASKNEQKYKVPIPIKRDPYEEFFELVIQAVKLNSPFMDDVLGINTKNWYKQVQGELIPFHKWYVWADQKLHNIRDELIKSREKSLLYTKRVIVF
ncbi:hypothetical protein PPERSA_04272 [Pseudocohnilembus persalinus]|uniref:Uncharacterized protein n=1 Tax=Pseudocohnilembus persalinus TaxID=266149 RepID=A0A0V0QNG0_PSEPJ|nr:hypothetical protein PPERSA_04272 [Pseudocohnilembus persalinus]|eukprot:KRX03764.1 hypothetical protein PPERSA_04272 [Pseudocohnilembus persalinus]